MVLFITNCPVLLKFPAQVLTTNLVTGPVVDAIPWGDTMLKGNPKLNVELLLIAQVTVWFSLCIATIEATMNNALFIIKPRLLRMERLSRRKKLAG